MNTTGIKQGFKKFFKAAAETFFPEKFTCDICGIEIFEGRLCKDCLKTVTFNDKAVCPVCGRKTVRPEICLECKADLPKFKKAVSPIVYEDGGVALVLKFKNGNGYLKEHFASLMASKLKDFPSSFDCIVYVPMTKKAVNRRGYNQAKLLAESLSEKIGVPWLKDAVIKTADTPEQKTLTKKERIANLEGCFKVAKREEIKGKSVLIVDDVLTTGATCEAMAKRLLSAGAKKIYLATVASVEYKQFKKSKKALTAKKKLMRRRKSERAKRR
ncbi:MAG: ComF family protein [Clostridia bacterium]|nr:ComF family protein [Clostridia bacterium]